MTVLVKTRMVRLGDVASFVRGVTFKPADVEEPSESNVDCMRTKNVQAELDRRDVWSVPKTIVKRPDQLLREGDLLVSSANSWNLVGKACWIPELERPTTFGGFVSVLRPKKVDPRYLFRWFSSDVVQATMRSFGNQTTNISNLDLKRASNLLLPLPPLDEQRRIAAILDKADELRTKRREALAHLDTLTQSIFHSMFDDPLPRNTPFAVERLADLCLKITDGTHHSPNIQASGIPYITAKHLRPTGLDFFGNPWFIAQKDHEEIYRRCDPKKGDVLYIKDGATTGLAAVNAYDFEFSMLSSLALLRPGTRLTAVYLAAWLNSPSVKADLIRGVAGAAITRFTLSKIKEFKFPLPPLELQQTFAARIASVERLKKMHRKHLAELDILFASLQDRAFKGDL